MDDETPGPGPHFTLYHFLLICCLLLAVFCLFVVSHWPEVHLNTCTRNDFTCRTFHLSSQDGGRWGRMNPSGGVTFPPASSVVKSAEQASLSLRRTVSKPSCWAVYYQLCSSAPSACKWNQSSALDTFICHVHLFVKTYFSLFVILFFCSLSWILSEPVLWPMWSVSVTPVQQSKWWRRKC